MAKDGNFSGSIDYNDKNNSVRGKEMNDEIRKRYMYIKYISKILVDRILIDKLKLKLPTRKKILGVPIYDYETQQRKIAELLAEERPISIIRPGCGEIASAYIRDEACFFGSKRYKNLGMYRIFDYDDESYQKWVDLLNQDMSEADAVVMMGLRSHMEEYLCEAYWHPKEIFHLFCLEFSPMSKNAPYDSWLYSLQGKRVLIVSMFAETMQKQLPHMDEIWGEKNPVKNIEFIFQKSVWFTGSNSSKQFSTWYEALEYLDRQIEQKEFDVAIISAGPFSMPLCANIKRRGGKAIQYGGSLQLLFGIRGNRWEHAPISNFFNDSWTRPSAEETPADANEMENACYW